MGSGTGARWVAIILLYFAIMTFTVAMINNIATDTIDDTSTDTSGTYCGLPRDIYKPYEPFPLDTSDITFNWRDHYEAHITCEKSAGVLDEDSCNSIEGCSWDEPSSFWNTISFGLFGGGEDTCVGTMNYSFITSTGTHGTLYGDEIDDFTDYYGNENSEVICDHPSVRNNETLCEALSCTWTYRQSVDGIEDLEIEPKLSLLSSIWGVVKDMVTFRFDFGFDDTTANFILNFLIFYLPLIGLGLAIYVMVRA